MNWPTLDTNPIEISQTDITCEALWAVAQGAMVSVDPTIVTTMNQNANAIPEDSQILASKRHWLTGEPSQFSDNLHKVLF